MPDSPRPMSPERQAELWSAFIDSYTASGTRPVVDTFLRALIGGPRREPAVTPEAA